MPGHPHNYNKSSQNSSSVRPGWSKESRAIAIESAYLRGTLAGSTKRDNAPALPEDYTKTMKTISEKQAALAGYRLADEIRDYVRP